MESLADTRRMNLHQWFKRPIVAGAFFFAIVGALIVFGVCRSYRNRAEFDATYDVGFLGGQITLTNGEEWTPDKNELWAREIGLRRPLWHDVFMNEHPAQITFGQPDLNEKSFEGFPQTVEGAISRMPFLKTVQIAENHPNREQVLDLAARFPSIQFRVVTGQ